MLLRVRYVQLKELQAVGTSVGGGGCGRSGSMWSNLSHYHVVVVGASSPPLRRRHRLPSSPSPFPLPLSRRAARFFHCRASSNATPLSPMGRVNRFPIPAVSDGGIGGNGGFGASGGSGGGDEEAGGGGGGGSSNNSILSWYLNELEKHPTLTKAWTSALLTFIGDLICQLLIDRAVTLDLKRTFVFTFLGFALVGPTLHFWYSFLSKLVTVPGALGAILRLLLDQFLFSPTFIGVFLASLVTLEGRPSEVMPKLKQEWFSSVIANWQLWIPFQFLNFQFVPQQFQVLAANLIALVWNVILSFKAHREIQPKSAE